MIRIRKYPRILLSVFTVGYIFTFFAIFDPTKRLFGIIAFAISVILSILYLLSDEYRSSRLLYSAKKLIDRGECEKASDLIVKADSFGQNEEVLVHINASAKKNPEYYGDTAEFLSKKIAGKESPFLRFVAASFFYTARNLKKSKQMLIDLPEERRTIKMVRLLGSVLYELKEYDKAIEVFSEFDPPYLPVNEDEIAVVYGIGICYIAKGENTKAVEALARVEAKNPRFGNVSKILNELTESPKEK